MGRVLKLKSGVNEPEMLPLPPDDGSPPDMGATDKRDTSCEGGSARSRVGAPISGGLPGSLSEDAFDDEQIEYSVACEEAEAAGLPPPPKPAPKVQADEDESPTGFQAPGIVNAGLNGRSVRTREGDLWALGMASMANSPSQINCRLLGDRAFVEFRLDGKILGADLPSNKGKLVGVRPLNGLLANPLRDLTEDTFAAALDALKDRPPPELEPLRVHAKDLRDIANEKYLLDAEEEELRAKRRRLCAPGILRGRVHEVSEIDRRLVAISERRETIVAEKAEIEKSADVLRRALREKLGPVISGSAQAVEQEARSMLITVQREMLKALAPLMRPYLAAYVTWRAGATWRDSAGNNPRNVDRLLASLLNFEDDTEGDQDQAEEAEAARGA